MERSTVVLILAFSVAIVAISLLIGLWAKKKVTTVQAFFGGTGMFGPVTVGLASMSGIASAFAVVGVPGIIYSTGHAMTFWMLSGAAFAMSYLILGKRIRAVAEIAPISSLGDICDIRFNNNRWIKGIMSLVICLGCVSYLAAQISAGSAMFSHLLGLPPIVTGLIIFGILTIYTAVSGEVGGILTQAFQGFIMVLASIAMLIAFASITGGFGNVLEAVGSVSEVASADGSIVKTLGPDFLNAWGVFPGNISLTWMLIPILGCVGQPQVLTRIYAVKNPKDLPKAGIVTAITHTIVGFVAVTTAYGALYLVATGKVEPFVKGDFAFYVFSDYAGVTIQLLGYAAVLAAAMSSASMFLTSTSTLLSKDLPNALGIRIAPEKQVGISRTFMVVLGLVAIVVSIYSAEMVAILGTFGWGTLVSGTFPVFVVGLLWERANEKGVLVGISISFILNILSLLKFKWPGGLPSYVSITAIAIASTIFISLMTPKQELSKNMKEVIRL